MTYGLSPSKVAAQESQRQRDTSPQGQQGEESTDRNSGRGLSTEHEEVQHKENTENSAGETKGSLFVKNTIST
jgi:hypothetical protein